MAAPIMLPRALLLEAARNVEAELGSLDDLPQELRDTVANVYFRSCELRRGLSPRTGIDVLTAGDPLSAFHGFMQRSSQVLADRKFVSELIRSVREARQADHRAYEYLIELTLDILKYKIKGASEKSPFRRTIERAFKRPAEYSGLYLTMQKVAGEHA